jgi:PAS domain S-box-containing protein
METDTDRKQAEEELRHSQERLQSFFDATFEGVVIHEGDKILDVNPAAEAMYGYSTTEMIGKSVQEIIATNSHEVLEGESCLSCDRPYEAIGQKKDGTTFVTELSSKNKDKIFDPFFTTKDVGKGTGLGLWICYQIIEKHWGQIAVNSQLGQGTEFVITLPVKQSLSLAA